MTTDQDLKDAVRLLRLAAPELRAGVASPILASSLLIIAQQIEDIPSFFAQPTTAEVMKP